MNTFQYPQENEVIIADGLEFEVVKVEKEQGQNGQSLDVVTI